MANARHPSVRPEALAKARPLALSLPALASLSAFVVFISLAAAVSASAAAAIFAGGSFWYLESVFDALPGVDSAVSGYMGGQGTAPDFESVAAGNSTSVEAVEVFYRPKRIAYAKLLDAYWRNIDPTRADGQFSDSGPQYRPVIFYRDAAQQQAANASRKRLAKSQRFAKPVVAEITPAGPFYRAGAEHQDYYKKKKGRYKVYMRFSGREAFLKKIWGAKPASPAAPVKPTR